MSLSARIVLALLLFTPPAGAQVFPALNILPDKPAPRGNFFTHPFHDKSVAALAAMHGGAATWDGTTTRMVLDRGGYERNPFMRPFVHNSGTLAAVTVGEVWISAFVADRMKHSRSAVLHKIWWLPQVVDISTHLAGGINNISGLGGCTPRCRL